MKLIFLFILTAITIDAHPQADRRFIRKGNGEYNGGNYQQAEVEYRKALEKDSLSFRAINNLGNALYRQKQYDAAAARYAGLAEKEHDKQKLSHYYYNLGNTLFESRKYQESADAYKNALRNNPADIDAKHNLQLALKMLNDQKQQQNKNNQKNKDQQQQKNKQNQDKQNQEQQQDEQNKNQQQKQKDQQNQSPEKPRQQIGQISPEDAERILQALENEEKNVMKKVQEKNERVKKDQVDKNW
jgi:Ca-activated chloride channel homolog